MQTRADHSKLGKKISISGARVLNSLNAFAAQSYKGIRYAPQQANSQ